MTTSPPATHHEAHHIDALYDPRPSSGFLEGGATSMVVHPPDVTARLEPEGKLDPDLSRHSSELLSAPGGGVRGRK